VGFPSNITIDEHKDAMRMGRDAEDVVAFMLSDEMGRQLSRPKGSACGTSRQSKGATLDALQPYVTPDGVVLGGACWLVTARKA
jgi:hypothetical protein